MDQTSQEVQLLKAEAVEQKRRIEKLEDNNKRHEDDIKQLYIHQEGTKIYVTQILQKIEALEGKMFVALTSANTNSTNERKSWIELIKYVISLTIGAIIMYLFQQGG